MKRLVLLFCACWPVACEGSRPEPYAPVQQVHYQAVGAEPFWTLAIGDDRIVLRIGSAEGGGAVWPRVLPRIVDGVRTWESGDGVRVIAVQARPGLCQTRTGQAYEDHVRVRLSGRELNGCGGRLVRRGPG